MKYSNLQFETKNRKHRDLILERLAELGYYFHSNRDYKEVEYMTYIQTWPDGGITKSDYDFCINRFDFKPATYEDLFPKVVKVKHNGILVCEMSDTGIIFHKTNELPLSFVDRLVEARKEILEEILVE